MSEVCCRRPMSMIEVTSPLAAAGATLALHTCASCGRHVWERDGALLDRLEVLDVVKDRIAEGPAARVPRPRRPRPSRARIVLPAPTVVDLDVQARLKGFTVHGS